MRGHNRKRRTSNDQSVCNMSNVKEKIFVSRSAIQKMATETGMSGSQLILPVRPSCTSVFCGSCGGSRTQRHADSPWSWLVCAASFISLTIVSGSYYCFGFLLPPLMDHFQQTRASVAWIGSLYLAAGNFLSPAISCLINRVGFRITAVLGGLLFATGACLSSYLTWFWPFYITFSLLSGVGSKAVYISSTLVVVRYFVNWRSVALGVISSAASVGMFVMTQFIQALLQSFGWQGAFRGLAAMFVVTVLCACVFDPNVSCQDCSERKSSSETNERNDRLREPSLLRNRDYILFCASAVFAFFGYFVPSVHMVKHCKQELGIAAKDMTMLYTYMAIASFVSRHAFCNLGDLDRFNRFHLYQFALTVDGVSLLLCYFARSYTALVVFFVVYGLMDGGIHALFPILVLECVGKDNFNRAFGISLCVCAVGISAGPPLAGLLADETGSYIPSFFAAGTSLLCGAVIMFLRTVIHGSSSEPIVKSSSCGTTDELHVVEKVTVL